MERWRVQLPPNVRPPFEVFVNGVPQQEGTDFELAPTGDTLLFRRELVQEGKLGFWRWFLGAWASAPTAATTSSTCATRSTAARSWPTA